MEKTEDIKNQYITLGNLAKLARIGRDTLSFYVKKQLIRPVFIGENGYKYFLPEQVQTVNFIRFSANSTFLWNRSPLCCTTKRNAPVPPNYYSNTTKNVSAKR